MASTHGLTATEGHRIRLRRTPMLKRSPTAILTRQHRLTRIRPSGTPPNPCCPSQQVSCDSPRSSVGTGLWSTASCHGSAISNSTFGPARRPARSETVPTNRRRCLGRLPCIPAGARRADSYARRRVLDRSLMRLTTMQSPMRACPRSRCRAGRGLRLPSETDRHGQALAIAHEDGRHGQSSSGSR